MKTPKFPLTTNAPIRPIVSTAEQVSATLSIMGRDHALGISTFALIIAVWLFTMIFI